MSERAAPEITRVSLQVLSLGLLIGGAFWIIQPFVPAMLWGIIIVVTTWPVFLKIQAKLWNRRVLAILVMVGALFVVVIVPCALAIGSIVSNTDKITGWANSLREAHLPSPPGFLERIPVLGQRLTDGWQKISDLTDEELSQKLAPYTDDVLSWFISKAGSLGALLIQFVLTMIIVIVLYARGESMGEVVRAFCRRLAGKRGDEVSMLAAKAVRGVALGVVVTALVQAVLSGIGLAVSGIRSAAVLTAIIFILCLCQLGPALIMIPAIIWLYWRGDVFSGSVLLGFAVVTLPLDNFMRPILIRKGADMPLLLVFIGVIGGLVAMGVIGLFIGPVILAVVHTLLKSWIYGEPAESQPSITG